ncbi:MFS transporter [Amycolatopsis pithecellobii]|uniref:MFS transporter n=1 Tax=Amycolatopsis pithecellobii TaxID=664692 RepID=A0A6N7Z5D2_9PSEU|nr:MFS transporter [Amycolatopsis pithecellobii]MTD54646.1 MFS transporter [Amycolatopsis pithecellobii]
MTGLGTRPAARFALVGAAMAFGYTAQQSVFPELLPLAVRLGVDKLWMGLVITVSGCVFLLSNPLWTFAARRWGSRRVLVAGLIGIVLSSVVFTLIVSWGPGSRWVGFAGVLLTRGVLFGLAMAAVAVSGPAFVLADSTAAGERGRAAAVITAAQGFGVLAGPLLDGITSAHGLIVLLLAPLAPLAVATALVARMDHGEQTNYEQRSSSSWGPFVRGVWPYLLVITSLLLFVATTQVTAGFLLTDRLGLSSDDAGRTAAWVLVAGSAPFLLAQLVTMSRPALPAGRMLQAGLALTLAGVLPLAFARTLPWILIGAIVAAIGIGCALPSCYEFVSRADNEPRHTRTAGAIAAAAGVAFAVGPVLAAWLYTAGTAVPFLAIAVLLLIGAAALFRS